MPGAWEGCIEGQGGEGNGHAGSGFQRACRMQRVCEVGLQLRPASGVSVRPVLADRKSLQ